MHLYRYGYFGSKNVKYRAEIALWGGFVHYIYTFSCR